MALAVQMATRECGRCGRTLAETGFYRTKKGHEDSQGVKRRNICKRCVDRQRDEYYAGVRYTVAAEPFAQWLDAKYDRYRREWGTGDNRNNQSASSGRVSFAVMLGSEEKTISRIMSREQRRVHIDTVDRVLLTEGSTNLFELYPDLYPGSEGEVAA